MNMANGKKHISEALSYSVFDDTVAMETYTVRKNFSQGGGNTIISTTIHN
jgi:hypothetical protein